MKKNKLVIFVIVLLGVTFFLLNYNLPLIRKSLVYANMSYQISEGDLFLEKYGVLFGFPLMAAPFVKLINATLGLRIVSAIFTILYIIISYFFFKCFNSLLSLKEDVIYLEMIFAFFNPLIIFQFISGYPDTLIAFLFILSFFLLDLLRKNQNIIIFSSYIISILISLTIKYNSLILFVLHPMYILFFWKEYNKILQKSFFKSFLGINILIFLFILIKYRLSLFQILFQRVFIGYTSANYTENLVTLVLFFFFYTFNFSLLFLFKANIKKAKEIFVIAALFTLITFLVPSSNYNLRYYLPILPFFSLFITYGYFKFNSNYRRVILVLFLLLNTVLILNYNTHSFNSFLSDKGIILRDEDNLRLGRMYELQNKFNEINSKLPKNATLHYVSNYYQHATHGVYSREGYFREDLNVVYHKDDNFTQYGKQYVWIEHLVPLPPTS